MKEENFKNCLEIFDKNGVLKRKDVVEVLKSAKLLESVERVQQYKKKLFWFIAFKDNFDAYSLIGFPFSVDGNEFKFDTCFKKDFIKTFKIMWLPPRFNKMKEIGDQLAAGVGKIEELKEIVDDDGIGTGKYNIKIKYPINSKINFGSITGKQKIDNINIFITMYGDNVRCTFCERYGHKKVNCPVYKLQCNDCGKRGHITEKCNMAHKIGKNEEEDEIDDEIDDENDMIVLAVNKNHEKVMVENRTKTSNNQSVADAAKVVTDEEIQVVSQPQYEAEFPPLEKAKTIKKKMTTSTPIDKKNKNQNQKEQQKQQHQVKRNKPDDRSNNETINGKNQKLLDSYLEGENSSN
jgi:hypothetical protein